MSPEGDRLLLTGGLPSERRAASPRFNGRGALVEFRDRTPQQRTRRLHTGSVTDLHGHGEVGLGLWNVGIHLERPSDTREARDTRAIAPGGGMTCVLTRRASALPSATCDILRYALVAQTRSVLPLDGARSTVPVPLEASSRGAMPVAGDALQLEWHGCSGCPTASW